MSYSFIVRHKDSSGLWSDYSSPTSFTTRAAEPVTVSVSSPVQNGNVVGATVNVTGSATANFGITEVRWTNDFGMTGTTVPAATWTASQIPIHPNQNAITISVKDDDGNTGTNLVQFNATIPDTTSPSLTVRFPTDGTEFNTILANTYLSGNAADENGISGISWVNNRGGQGTATGAESWAIGPLTLAAGDNLVTVRATDTAGNFTEKTLLIRFTQLTALENWRQLYFNSTANSGLGADGVDADGDGLTNLFEFVAGLIPNDPASHFNLRVEAVPAVAGQRKIIFSPLVAGRTYIVKSKASLAAPTWTPLTSFTTADNGTERTVTDLAATGPKFYTVEITKP